LPPAFLAAQYLYCCTVYLCHGARHCRMSSLTTGAAAVVSAAVFCSVLAPVNGCMTLCWCCSLLVLSPPAEDFCCAVASCQRTFVVLSPPAGGLLLCDTPLFRVGWASRVVDTPLFRVGWASHAVDTPLALGLCAFAVALRRAACHGRIAARHGLRTSMGQRWPNSAPPAPTLWCHRRK